MTAYTNSGPLKYDDDVKYSTVRGSFTIDAVDEDDTDMLDGDVFTAIMTGAPQDISVAVFPGALATMTVEYTLSEKYDDKFFAWPNGAVTADSHDVILGHVYSFKITCTGGPGQFYIGT